MGERVRELAERVLSAAKVCKMSLATAESCTGGAIAVALAGAPGAGDCFHGGIVALSFPKIISAHSDGAVRKGLAC